MQSTLYAIARPSVCPSHGWISQKLLKLGSCYFHHRVAHFTTKFQREHPKELWRQMREGRKNTQFSANIPPPYLRNGAIYDQGSYDGLIGSRICAFDWYQNHRPWMNLTIRYALYCCKNLNEDRPILSAAKM